MSTSPVIPPAVAPVLGTLLAYHAHLSTIVRAAAAIQGARPGEGLAAVADRHAAWAEALIAIGVAMPAVAPEAELPLVPAAMLAAPETGGAA